MNKFQTVFVSGIPSVGKTSILGMIAKEIGIDIVLSGDYLREFYRGTCESRAPVMETSVYDAWKAFGEKNRENIVAGYLAQSAIMSRGIVPLIERADKNGEGLVIESLYFDKEIVAAIKANNVTAVYLYISDKGVHEKRIMERSTYTHIRSPGDRLLPQLDAYREMMNYSLDLCKENGIATFDNLDFDKTVKEVMAFIRKEK